MINILGKILGNAIALTVFIIPEGIITVFREGLRILEKGFKLTAKAIRIFIAEFLICEFIFEFIPMFTGEGIYGSKLFMGLYCLVAEFQWDTDLFYSFINYLVSGQIVRELSVLPEFVLVILGMFSIGILIMAVITLAILLNLKYIIFLMIIDTVSFTFRLINKASKERAEIYDKVNSNLKEAGYVKF